VFHVKRARWSVPKWERRKMMDEIMEKVPCVYTLSTGITLFSETAEKEGEDFVFDGKTTAVLLISQGPNGEQGVQAMRMNDCHFAFFAREMRVNPSFVVSVSAPGNSDLLKNCRQAVSGIILTGPRR
jgi:hypothetical protein